MQMGDTAEQILAELVACKDWRNKLPKDVSEAAYFVATKNAEMKEAAAWIAARAHLAAGQAAGEDVIGDFQKESREAHWHKLLGEQRQGERRNASKEAQARFKRWNPDHRRGIDRRARAIAEGEG